jgi:hypothetical protein
MNQGTNHARKKHLVKDQRRKQGKQIKQRITKEAAGGLILLFCVGCDQGVGQG